LPDVDLYLLVREFEIKGDDRLLEALIGFIYKSIYPSPLSGEWSLGDYYVYPSV